jgi:uncharacterized repeat protein (TIGR03803 family)
MKGSNLSHYAFSSCVAAAMLAGCSAQPPIGALGVTSEAPTRANAGASSSYRVLHRFANVPHGAHPVANLVDVNGTLYGTTLRGGSSNNGTVFSLSPTGHTKVLYSFGGGADGAWPRAGLIDVNGTLYGTTARGGGSGCYTGDGCGTVYSINRSGLEKVLYRFGGGSDGANPWAGLIDVNGTLYGTTAAGGSSNAGTVYSITTSGSEKVLYSFGTRAFDGYIPEAGLIEVKGTLYGTTSIGGANRCFSNISCGVVFSVSTTGMENVLYNFAGYADGAHPQTGLTNVKGTLYGTTYNGGSSCDCGTVFSVSTTGSEKVLYNFGNGSGVYPLAGLVDVNGTLYGTTSFGGASNKGTVYSVSTGGVGNVLYSFGAAPDGAAPFASLINRKGTLYGTTSEGGVGCGSRGCGTVFALSP